MKVLHRLATTMMLLPVLVACAQQDENIANAQVYDGISEGETISLSGTEPFWSITIAQGVATYSTPENAQGTDFAVARFAGNNGLGFSGELNGENVLIAVTPGKCNDAMSDREYPFTATIALGDRSLSGCAYTDRQPFKGDARP